MESYLFKLNITEFSMSVEVLWEMCLGVNWTFSSYIYMKISLTQKGVIFFSNKKNSFVFTLLESGQYKMSSGCSGLLHIKAKHSEQLSE